MIPDPLLGARRAALLALDDAELTERYEELRDIRGVAPDGAAVYPNLSALAGSALEREKDRREVRAQAAGPDLPEMQAFYAAARTESIGWWLEHQLGARHALQSCMSCGMCTSLCPAAEFNEDYNPREIVDAAVTRDERTLERLLASDVPWLCGQCGSCVPRCPRGNSIMGLISSLRLCAQLKGLHVKSVRGRQQYAARHLWGANFWNRGCSVYFRNPTPEGHPDFGPRHARHFAELDAQMRRVGAHPDMDGTLGGRKLDPRTLAELRACVREGGTLTLWNAIEESAAEQAAELDLDLDEYLTRVGTEG